MIPHISIIIPTLGEDDLLNRLLQSLAQQESSHTVEVLLCTSSPSNLSENRLVKLPPQMNLKILETSQPGISAARNMGLDQARGELILFLDDDCVLPHKRYLNLVFDHYQKHPSSGGGGLYLTESTLNSSASSFYNYMCNSWLKSHVSPNGSTSLLLGGCCFFPREALGSVRFPVHKPRAGEEVQFNADLIRQGMMLYFDTRLSVYHSPRYGLKDVFLRAWKQGLQIESQTLPGKNRWQRYWQESQSNPKDFIKFLPLTVAYTAWGRLAYYSKILNK